MELMIAQLLVFALVLTRLSAFFLVSPIFGSKSVQAKTKIAAIVLLAIVVIINNPVKTTFAEINLIEAIILLCYEASYGLCLGLVTALMFAAVRVAGRIIERQMGMAMAQVMDPLTGERGQPLSMLLEMLFLLMFLSADGHQLLIMIITKSCQSFPVTQIPTLSVMTESVVSTGSMMLVAALRISAPMLGAFIVLMFALAMLARITPDMNILFISMPLRVGLGLLMMSIFVPYTNSFVAEFAEWMEKLLPM